MKSGASIKSVLLVSFFVAATPVCADTDDCASPPGPRGTIRCESDQIAICEATGSRVNGQCLSRRGKKGKELSAQILSVILNRQIGADEVHRDEYQRALREKRITRPNGTVVTFSYNDDSPGSEPDREPAPLSRPRTPIEKKYTCTACVAVNNRKICESGTDPSKEEATKAAVGKLRQRLTVDFGSTLDPSVIQQPSIECK